MKVMAMEQAKVVNGGGPISSLGTLAAASGPLFTALGQFMPTLGGYLQNPKNFNSNGK